MSLNFFNITAALFAAGAYASTVLAADGTLLLGSSDVLRRSYVEVLQTDMYRRQQAGEITNTNDTVGDNLNPGGSMTFEEWDQTTNDACIKALSILPQSTNPSGHCICYNLPSLNTETGAFEADLRMYKLSQARDGFEGVAPKDIQVDVFYAGAGVKRTDEVTLAGMVGTVSSIAKRQNSNPELLRVFMLSGQINDANMTSGLSMAKLEELVLPVFTLTARTPSGDLVRTNVSTNEASFLTGVFADQVVLSDFATAQAAVQNSLEQLRNKEIAFVLPGVQIMVFPIGLIITSIWLTLGLAAYGWGTFERINYAEMYKSRKTAVQKSASKTF
ncbi:hypothetical protein S40293_02597 [Stachybotrys chartarum IBT 40293]|nr:hypothetical protein S40293_02597 [Stachybotrys chartarum IBT 40293]